MYAIRSYYDNITNYVVMNYTANALLAMGASPVMAHASNEVEEMVSFAGALVLNIGTLTKDWVVITSYSIHYTKLYDSIPFYLSDPAAGASHK